MKREGKDTKRAPPTTNAMATTIITLIITPTTGTERLTGTTITSTPTTTTMLATAETQKSIMEVVIMPTVDTKIKIKPNFC